ncbi:MAG: cobalamin-binding protein [Phycisphaerae bacterium]|jgi:iron complex transport system substrate-binding protein|nr:MAG: cobalamin-binding protein [Phycisphaerae bacterium]
MRIVSLLPAATAIVESLGRAADLVGVSHACKPSDSSLPRLTSSRVPLYLSATETDAQVKELLRRGEPLFKLDESLLGSLEPDVVLSQSLCNVCAIDGNHLSRIVKERGRETRLFEWSATTLSEVMSGIEQIGQVIGVTDAGRALADSMRERLWSIRQKTRLIPHRPRVVFLEWLNPLFCAGHWIPELVEIAGGVELLGQAGRYSRQISANQLVAADPDWIIACCCGRTKVQTSEELQRLENEMWWQSLRAVRSGRVHVVDAEKAFTMPAPQLVDDCQLLADLFARESCVSAYQSEA